MPKAIPIKPGEDARIRYFLEQGCSYKEVADSTGVSVGRLKKYYPGFGWSIVFAASFAAEVRGILRRTPPGWRLFEPSRGAPAGSK